MHLYQQFYSNLQFYLENLIEELGKIHNKGEIIVTMGAGDLWLKGKDIIGYLSK